MAGKTTINYTIKGRADLDINPLKNSVQEAKNLFKQLKLPDNLGDSFEKQIGDILKGIEKLSSKIAKGFYSEKEVDSAVKEYEALSRAITDYNKQLQKIAPGSKGIELLSGKNTKELKQVATLLNKVENATDDFNKTWEVVSQNFTKELKADIDIEKFHEAAEAGKDFHEITEKSAKEARTRLTEVNEQLENYRKREVELLNLEKQRGGTLEAKDRNELRMIQSKTSKAGVTKVELIAQRDALITQKTALDQLNKSYDKYVILLSNLKHNEVSTNVEELRNRFQELSQLTDQELVQVLEQLQKSGESAAQGMHPVATAMGEIIESAEKLGTTQKILGEFTRRIEYFFSIGSAIRLATRGFRNAVQVVKDLDREMTEIAVVTPMTLDQVWSRRSGYVKVAKELGAATLDVVAASKLYYQQGLSEAEVNKITIETIKMARIAHLDGARATDLMTAALRGFNLEMSQAEHINDVYSELAAKSAASTEEIANAMTKTASIAYSAGASFDNTAAFLTQMIETTREASENLGTAMKTIVARFQEMKKAPDEIGEVDGEIIDANRFETALKSIGVALRDLRTGEFRAFDDVIMDISAKWDSLDQLSQRYIATTAAGSRQQSRFIALVSNNARLLELTGLATESAGAAQEQFNKTLDSLEAKLNRLNTAKELFFTNILDSGAIKAAVGGMTGIVEAINKLTGSFSGLGNSVATMLLSFGGFTIIPKAVKKVLQSVGLVAVEEGEKAGKEFIDGILRGAKTQEPTTSFGKIFQNLFGKDQFVKKEIKSVEELSQTYGSLTSVIDELSTAQVANLGYLSETTLASLDERVAKIDLMAVDDMRNAQLQMELLTEELNLEMQRNKTEELIKEQVAKMGLFASTMTYIKALIAETAAKAAGNIVEKESNALLKKAALDRMKNTAIMWGYKLAILAAVAAIGLLIYAIERAIVTDKERLKQFQQNIEKYKNLIDDTKNSIQDLESSFEELGELQKKLDDLTYGTKEWNQALIEVNNKVLELVNNFPALAAYVERTDRGLSIKAEGYEKVLEQQYKSLVSQQQAQLVNQIEALELEFKIDNKSFSKLKKELENNFKVSFEDVQKIASEFVQRGGSVENLEGSSDLLEELFKDAEGSFEDLLEVIKENKDQFKELGENTIKFNEELYGFSSALYATFEDDQTLGPLLKDEVTGPIVKAIFEANKDKDPKFVSALREARDDVKKESTSSERGTFIAKKYGGAYGVADKVSFDTIDLEAEYKRLHTYTDEEFKELRKKKDITYEMMVEEVAQNRVRKKLLEETKANALQFEKELNNHPLLGKSLLNIIDKDFENLTKEQLDELNSYLEKQSDGTLKTMRDLLGISEERLGELKEEADRIQDEIQAKIKETITSPEQYNALTAGLGLKLRGEFANILETILVQSGQEAVDTTLDILSKSFAGLSDEKIGEVLEYFTSIDPSSTQELKEFGQYLKELGAGLDSNEINRVVDDLGKVNKAIYKLDTKELKDKITAIGKAIKDVTSKDTRKISQETYDLILKEAPDFTSQFRQDLEGNWIYVGDSIEKIRPILENISKQMIKDSRERLQGKVAAGTVAEGFKYSGQRAKGMGAVETYTLDYKQASKESVHFQRKYLDEYIKELRSQGITDANISELLGFDPEGVLTLKDKEIIKTAFDNIQTYTAELKNNEAAEKGLGLSEAVLELQPKDPLVLLQETQNIFDSTQLENYSYALMLMGEEYDSLTKYVNELSRAQASGNVNQTKAALAALAQGIAYERATKLLGNYSNEIENATKILKGLEEATPEETFRSLNFIFNDLLDLDLSEEFLTDAENYDLFMRVLEGSQEAWEELLNSFNGTQISTEEVGDAVLEFGEKFHWTGNTIQDIINELDGSGFEVTGDADVTALINKLVAAGATTEEAIALLEELGSAKIIGTPHWEKIHDEITGQTRNYFKGVTYHYESTAKKRTFPGVTPFVPSKTPFTKKDTTDKSSGGADKENPWENSYDWLYNLLQKTNTEIRKRNKLEWEYGKLLKDNTYSVADIVKNIKEQEASLKQQLRYYKDQEEGRKIELEVISKGYSDVSKYANLDVATNTISIDWAKIEQVEDPEVGERIAAYIGHLERIHSELENIEDSQHDTIDKLEELKQLGKDNYMSLEQRIYDALVAQREDEIDTLQKINESINRGNTQLLNKLQKGIDDQRRSREREKALSGIGEKQRRLALLRQDVSGANALEILKLQEELEQEQENYTDTLIDKTLQELQDGHQAAAEQRERQIEVMQNQLDYDKETGVIWEEVERLLTTLIDEDGSINVNSPIFGLLEKWEGVDSMSNLQREDWKSELSEQIQAGMSWLLGQEELAETTDVEKLDGTVSGLEKPLVDAIKATEKYHPKPDPNTKGIKDNTATANQYLKKIADNAKPPSIEVTIQPEARSPYQKSYSPNPIIGVNTQYAYAGGGLADYTGPAWLDGTKSQPEAVLDPQQTKNFIHLRNILDDIMKAPKNAGTNPSGNNYYSFDVQVDQLANDYDVEQLVKKMKRMITDDALYRNVNALSFQSR